MFYLLKFTYNVQHIIGIDTPAHFTYVVLNEEEYLKFDEYNGKQERFNYQTDIGVVPCVFVDAVLWERMTLPLRQMFNDVKLHRIITRWMFECSFDFYLLSFACIYKDDHCDTECTHARYRTKEVLLTPAQYEQFKQMGGMKHIFTLSNNHMRCDNGHSIYTVWVFTGAISCRGYLASYDMTQAVYQMLGLAKNDE